jgi:hypothetical protein
MGAKDANLLRYAAPTGTVLIRWDGSRQPDVWNVPALEMDPHKARLELARRYLHVFGLATPEAFASLLQPPTTALAVAPRQWRCRASAVQLPPPTGGARCGPSALAQVCSRRFSPTPCGALGFLPGPPPGGAAATALGRRKCQKRQYRKSHSGTLSAGSAFKRRTNCLS